MPDPANEAYTEELKAALLDQVAYLIDEVDALRGVIDRVPQSVLEGRPLDGDRSIKELFGLLAARDEKVYLPFLEHVMAEGGRSSLDPVPESELLAVAEWNRQPIDDILERLQRARGALLQVLHEMPVRAWGRRGYYGEERLDVFQLTHSITQHDADLLRAVGYRLHESNLSNRPSGLPK